ncbi:integrase [Synergistales bacterium]|nr:integrase [Synergistales bacterium]
MPKVRFSNSVLSSLKADPDKGVWYSDEGCTGLQLYVGASGKKTYYVHYRRKDRKLAHHKIGDADLFSVSQARETTKAFLAAVALGETPYIKPEITEKIFLQSFIRDIYAPWVIEHRRTGQATVAMIESSFGSLFTEPIESISVEALEKLRSKKHADGAKASTLNRQATALKAALNWGVKRGIFETNPMAKLERLPEEDSETKLRYLSPGERARLDAALNTREKKIRDERDSHNVWLEKRSMPLLPDLKKAAFADHIKPMIIVSLNSGIRQGALFKLLWSDIDFSEGILTVRPESSKSGKIIHIPMNATLSETLAAWKKQTSGEGLVFRSSKSGGKFDNCDSAWRALLEDAQIKNFRWHDMRHDFASQLVMKGVDLNTVRELMGHADLKMTLRYAHLAPKVKKAAVDLIG